MKTRKRKVAAQSSGKKPYHAPKLLAYGDLVRLTKSKQGQNGDGGAKPNTRTTGMPA